MNAYHVSVAADVDALPAQVYATIADYHAGHPAMLPSRTFTDMQVTAGGYGAGTRVTVRMNVFGAKAVCHLAVTEPEPGRVLQEEDREAGVTTSFTVEPLADSRQSRVTIATTARTAPGLRGRLERWLNPLITRRTYREELRQLAALLASNLGDASGHADAS